MPVSWLYYPTVSAPMPFQMALDEILFRAMTESEEPRDTQKPFLRFYYSSEPWISAGYAYAGWKNYEAGAELHSEAGEESIPLCRRITGGGKVLHGNDLMFTLAAPKCADESFGSVKLSYRKIHEAVKFALDCIGKNPRFYSAEENLPRGEECFVYPIETDLEVNGRKAAGGGQKRSLGVLLHQESIQMKGLGDQDVLQTKIELGIQKIFGIRLEPAVFRPELLIQAEKLGDEKYKVIRRFEGAANKA